MVTGEDLRSGSVRLSDDESAVVIIDQTQLPNREEYLELRTAKEIYDAIRTLAVRGAPAIGICAGYAMYVLAQQKVSDQWKMPEDRELTVQRELSAQQKMPAQQKMSEEQRIPAETQSLPSYEAFAKAIREDGEYLISSRPTAVNLSWAVRRMLDVVSSHEGEPPTEILKLLREECIAIHQGEIDMCRKISEYGLTLVKPGDGILTHCNAGPLATAKYGTAIGPILLGKERGIDFKVFADETRPLLQGARLTSYELQKAGVDVTLICDNMASMVMKNGWIQACFVGCDRIAANGDFANKIGTSGVAILAKHYGIPFYTLGPSSTVDMSCPTGDDIKIEMREPDEIRTMWYKEPMALPDVKCFNPSFDVTDHELVTAIVTDRGIVYPPFDVNLKKLFNDGSNDPASEDIF